MKIVPPILAFMSFFVTVSSAFAQESATKNLIKTNVSTGLAISLGILAILYLIGMSLYIVNNRRGSKSKFDSLGLNEGEILHPIDIDKGEKRSDVEVTLD
jgi:hypothetical protein